MASAALLRQQIESSLSDRIPVALSPRARTRPEQTACGIAELDALLRGGLPAGSLTELVGVEGSGRTSAALAYMAALTRGGGVCAWIDVADALDPESAAASGVDLERLLWVRCGAAADGATTQRREPARAGKPGPASPPKPAAGGGCGGLHPRSEGRGMPEAVGALLGSQRGQSDGQARREKKSIGTPGMANRPLSSTQPGSAAPNKSVHREEQPNSDRLPPRRGENLVLAPRVAESERKRPLAVPSAEGTFSRTSPARPAAGGSSQALDQALRAADLLLQGGGFGAIVLDLASTPPEVAWRIPLASWFRFRAACERTRSSLLVLTRHPCTRSSAELVVQMQPGVLDAGATVMRGVRYQAATERSRSYAAGPRVVPIRKPPQPEATGSWKSEAAWA